MNASRSYARHVIFLLRTTETFLGFLLVSMACPKKRRFCPQKEFVDDSILQEKKEKQKQELRRMILVGK